MKSRTIISVKHSAFCILVSAITGLILVSLYAYLLSKETMQISSSNYIIPTIQFLSSIIAAIYLSKVESEKLLIKYLIQSAVVLIMMLLVTLMIYNGKIHINIISLLAVIGGYFITAIVQMKKRGKEKTRRYKYKNS